MSLAPHLLSPLIDVLPRQICLTRNIRHRPTANTNALQDRDLLGIRPAMATLTSQNFNMRHQKSAPPYDVVTDVNNDIA